MKKKLFIFLVFMALKLQAASSDTILELPFSTGVAFATIIGFLILIIIFLLALMISFGRFYYNEQKKNEGSVSGFVKLFGVFEGDLTAVTSEYQDQVIHEYDGIQEYDNDLPPWWKAGFYLGIVFAIAYLFVYHVIEVAPLQTEEYANEIEEAKILYADIDQVYDAPITEKAELENAEAIYLKNCKACHGANGEGSVGPNLTDQYWLHGGDVNAIYTTIKYGVIEKGMKAWKSEFSNQDIYEISSYILTMQGSNPANAKEPQGELVK